MAFEIESYEIEMNGDAATVSWVCKDDSDATIKKRGSFQHTIVDTDTWSKVKSDIETKIDASEGVVS